MKDKLKYYSKRFNQILLTFPVWLSLGLAKPFKKSKKTNGWKNMKKSKDYGKMF